MIHKRTWAFVCTILILPLLVSLEAFGEKQPAKAEGGGKLFVFGGSKISDASLKVMLKDSGGAHSSVLVIPFASKRPEAGSENKKMWERVGAKKVEVLAASGTEAARRAIAKADLIWMSGGSQNRLMRKLKEYGFVKGIQRRHKEGASIGGTSAGAAVMSDVMLTGEAELSSIVTYGTETAEGLGLWKGVIVDQHFHRRKRFNRLLSAVTDRPQLVGIGIDESTGVVVDGQDLEVIGKSSVLVIDMRKATSVRPKKAKSACGLRDAKLHLLIPGMPLKL